MGRRAPANRLPAALRELAESHEEFVARRRTLFQPEVRALCTRMRDGIPRPFPGVHIASKTIPAEGKERRLYVVNFDVSFLEPRYNVVLLLTAPFAQTEPVLAPHHVDKAVVHFDRPRVDIEQIEIAGSGLRVREDARGAGLVEAEAANHV